MERRTAGLGTLHHRIPQATLFQTAPRHGKQQEGDESFRHHRSYEIAEHPPHPFGGKRIVETAEGIGGAGYPHYHYCDYLHHYDTEAEIGNVLIVHQDEGFPSRGYEAQEPLRQVVWH